MKTHFLIGFMIASLSTSMGCELAPVIIGVGGGAAVGGAVGTYGVYKYAEYKRSEKLNDKKKQKPPQE